MADDPLISLSSINYSPTIINRSNYTATDADQDEFLLDSPLSTTNSLELLAQELLQRIGWTYYTIWKKADPPFMSIMQLDRNVARTPPGLVWSKGDVNIDLLMTGAGAAKEQSRACKMGLALQQFYQRCSLLPLGTGIAGRAIASSKYQWVSGYELLQQVSTLSSFNNQPIMPSELQAQDFQTVVCIPLEKDVGVLEVGTTTQVGESVGLLSQILKFTNEPTISRQLGQGEPDVISRTFDGAREYDDALKRREEHTTTVGYATNEEHTPLGYASDAMQIYGNSRAVVLTRQQSLPSSHSSATSSSPHQLEQIGKSTTVLTPSPAHNRFNSNEEVLMNPVSMVTSFSQLDLLNQLMGHNIGEYGGTISSTSSGLITSQIHDLCDTTPSNYLDQYDEHLFSDNTAFHNYLISSALKGPSSAPMPSLSIHEYMPQEPSYHQYHHMSDLALNSSMLVQPLQCAAGCDANIIHQVNIEAHESSAGGPTTIPIQHNPVARNKGKQAETYSALMYPRIVEKSSDINRTTTSMAQGSTSSVNPSATALIVHQKTNVNPAITSRSSDPETALMIKGFRPWSRSMPFKLIKKKMNISVTNRYNVKQIMRFHLPSWFKDMMHQEASKRRAVNFALINVRQRTSTYTAEADYSTAVGTTTDETQDQNISNVQNEAAAKQHMIAERKRRRKQGDCLAALRTLVPNITKRDKVTILEHTIDYLKEMNSLISELQKQNNALMKENVQCPQNIAERSYMSQNDATLQSLAYTPNISTRNATCVFHHSPSHGTLPHFELDMSVELEEKEVNASIIRVISALQQKELKCIDVKVTFQQELRIIYAKIRAQYKDENKNIPNRNDIQDIEQWWRHFVESRFSTSLPQG